MQVLKKDYLLRDVIANPLNLLHLFKKNIRFLKIWYNCLIFHFEGGIANPTKSYGGHEKF